MPPQEILTVAGLVIAGVGTWIAARTTTIHSRVARFTRNYDRLGAYETALGHQAWSRAPIDWRHPDIPMLARSEWIADEPWPLDSVRVEWAAAHPGRTVSGLVKRTRALRGLRPGGPITYSQALTDIAGMSHFFNGKIYRPVVIDFSGSSRSISFDEAAYFDYLDTSEILAYHAALPTSSPLSRILNNRYRRKLADPFDLTNRVASLGVLTLTIRTSPDSTTFFMHKRNPTRVVLGAELFHVIPAGEFTPSDVSAEAVRADFDLWRNIAREYAEEFLGVEAAQGHSGRSIDYAGDSPFRELMDARADGRLVVSVLGIALDPLTWKPELLTTAVFESATFDYIFADLVAKNDEGVLITKRGIGLPFDEKTIRRYTEHQATRAGAKACLSLAWRSRDQLGLPL